MNMKKTRWRLMCTLFLSLLFAVRFTASNEVVGRITLTIINRPPEIIGLYFSPGIAYTDSQLRCIAEVGDEDKEHARAEYAWLVNGKEIDEQTNSLVNLKENDVVECIATPMDSQGLGGEPRSISLVVSKVHPPVAMTKALVNMLGGKITLEESAQLEKKGIPAITGYVTAQAYGNTNFIWLLITIVIILILINLNLFLRMKMRKRENQTSSHRAE